MKKLLTKVLDTTGYSHALIFIAAVTFAIIKSTNYNPYIIAFMSFFFSHWLLDRILEIIKNIGNKRGWFDE